MGKGTKGYSKTTLKDLWSLPTYKQLAYAPADKKVQSLREPRYVMQAKLAVETHEMTEETRRITKETQHLASATTDKASATEDMASATKDMASRTRRMAIATALMATATFGAAVVHALVGMKIISG